MRGDGVLFEGLVGFSFLYGGWGLFCLGFPSSGLRLPHHLMDLPMRC